MRKYLKGTVSREFLPSYFAINNPLAPQINILKYF
jgi:hypothetical protein